MADVPRYSSDSEDTTVDQTGYEKLLGQETPIFQTRDQKVSVRRWRALLAVVVLGFVLNASWTLALFTKWSTRQCKHQNQEEHVNILYEPPQLIHC